MYPVLWNAERDEGDCGRGEWVPDMGLTNVGMSTSSVTQNGGEGSYEYLDV